MRSAPIRTPVTVPCRRLRRARHDLLAPAGGDRVANRAGNMCLHAYSATGGKNQAEKDLSRQHQEL
jgi:hypothetical protein